MYGAYRMSLAAVFAVAAEQAKRILADLEESHKRTEFTRARWTEVRRNAWDEHARTKEATELAIKQLRAAVKEIENAQGS